MKYLITILLIICSLFSCTQPENNSTTKAREQESSPTPTENKKTIVFYGNSITAGYGLDPSDAFPALIQQKIDSMELPYTVVNAGVSGETSTSGNGRIDWILKQPLDILVLELGANDGLRGIPLTETKKSLQQIIDKVKKTYPAATIILAGMQIPPNMGQTYTTQFRNLFPDLAKTNDIKLIPFLLEGVGGERQFNQNDGIHPNEAGAKIVAENVWPVLYPLL
jgi:acyl-CoA thioesterase I